MFKIIKKSGFLLCALAGALAFSCDHIEDGNYYNEVQLPESKGQSILLEEYTGQKCPNCPEGAVVASQLSKKYGDKLIVVSVHAGGFSLPDVNPNSPYQADYRTPAGDAYVSHYKVEDYGYPAAMMNRKLSGTSAVLSSGKWDAKVLELYTQEPALSLQANAAIASGNITIKVEGSFKTSYTAQGDVNLSVWIVEDSLVSPQLTKQKPPLVRDYVHRHVLRACASGVWGDKLFDANVSKDAIIDKNFSIALDPKWNTRKLYVVAFVSDNGTKEILQVCETHVN